jgi:hypothetical protein
MQYLQSFLKDLFKVLEWNVLHLEGNTKKLSEKLIGLRYNMEDHKAITSDAQGVVK